MSCRARNSEREGRTAELLSDLRLCRDVERLEEGAQDDDVGRLLEDAGERVVVAVELLRRDEAREVGEGGADRGEGWVERGEEGGDCGRKRG